MSHDAMKRPLVLAILAVLMIGGAVGAEERLRRTTGDAPRLPDLPVGIASFGATMIGDWLYVYGGHTGETHSYSTEEVTNAFRRLNVRDGGKWEELPTGPALQGLTLVGHGGYVYRIGGMMALNKPGDADDLRSVDEVGRFDPRSNEWTAIAPLPEARSSHGAVVVGDRLYVVGGWRLGRGEPQWHTTALVLDLADPRPTWKTIPEPPFKRRALAVEAVGGTLLVTGGLIDGGMTSETDIFDLDTQSWSRGPAIPGSKFNAIGMAACNLEGRIAVNGMDGPIYSLDPTGGQWQECGSLRPGRFHHHLFPQGPGTLLSVGGATRSGKVLSVDRVEVSQGSN